MKLSKDMLAALKGHMKGHMEGTPYGPELCDLGLLMVFEGEYVCTQAGIKACGQAGTAKEMKPSDLYVLCHLHCYNLIPNEECQPQIERLQALNLVDEQERITELGLDHIQKGLIV